jgi:hypothetical protein
MRIITLWKSERRQSKMEEDIVKVSKPPRTLSVTDATPPNAVSETTACGIHPSLFSNLLDHMSPATVP